MVLNRDAKTCTMRPNVDIIRVFGGEPDSLVAATRGSHAVIRLYLARPPSTPLPAPPFPALVTLGPLDANRMVFTECDIEFERPQARRMDYRKACRPLFVSVPRLPAEQSPVYDSVAEGPP